MIKKLNFDDEGLIVDWLAFKIESLNSFEEEELADYLFSAGFNSYSQLRNSNDLKDFSKSILKSHSSNKFKVIFRKDTRYWDGTVLEFSGTNARQFYNFLKQGTLDWKLFRNPTLSRVDLYYTLETSLTQEEVRLFFQTCRVKSQLNVGYQKNKTGQILKIGRRSSDRFSRIYTRRDKLRFEHEMKGRFIGDYSNMLIDNRWEDFEDVISQHFLQYFGKHLPIDSIYLDWLVVKLRSIRPDPVPKLIFKMDYISKIDNLNDQIKVVNFLKFLVYAKDLDYVTESLGSTSYRCLSFRVQDFVKFQNLTSDSISQYKIKQSKEFFEELQKGFLLSMFRDQKFQLLISIPKVLFWKQRSWMAKVWIVDELFYYNYPFAFPDLFDPNISKTKFAVQFEIIRVFSALGLEKKFHIQQFLDSYPSTLSNHSISQIKEFFIESVKVLKENKLIQPRFKILRNGMMESVDVLTSQNISEGFVLYEELNFLDLEY